MKRVTGIGGIFFKAKDAAAGTMNGLRSMSFGAAIEYDARRML